MISPDEEMQLVERLNQCRTSFGQRVEPDNDMAIRSDLQAFERMSKQFPDFTLVDFEQAMILALDAMRDKKDAALPEHKYGIRLEAKHVNGQCMAMAIARRIKKTPLNTLPEPKPERKSGPDWLAQDFPEMWATMKYSGMIAPVWQDDIFPDRREMKALNAALAAHTDFSEGRRENARLETYNDFVGEIHREMKLQNLPAHIIFHEQGYNYPELLPLIQSKIDEYNAHALVKFRFNASATWIRCKAIVAIRCYGRILDGIKAEDKKAVPAVIGNISQQLKEIKE